MNAQTSHSRTAIVLGASGSVGEALMDELLRSDGFGKILVMARRPLGRVLPAQVEERLVPDMTPPALERAVAAALREVPGEAVGFSVLGVGAGTAKLTLAQHRAVDVDLNAAFARGLATSERVRQLAFMSAIGADASAGTQGSGAAGMPRYARVKGEAEAAVTREGPPIVSIFRPAMIIGSRHTPGLLSAVLPLFSPVTPARFRSIRTTEIAGAMVAIALRPPAASAVYAYPEMKALIEAA